MARNDYPRPPPAPHAVRALPRASRTPPWLVLAATALALLGGTPVAGGTPPPLVGGPVRSPTSAASGAAEAPPLPAPLSGWWPLPVGATHPSARTAYQMATDSEDGYVLLFGGCPGYAFQAMCGTSVMNDTWTFSGGAWTNVTATLTLIPPARSAGVMADDPAAGGVILFGGQAGGCTLADTWEWLGGVWIRLAPAASPPALTGAAMAYDASDGELVLTGGALSGTTNMSSTTWTFKDGTWTNATAAAGPPGWYLPAFTPDPVSGGALLYGGVSLGLTPRHDAQTWRFADGAWTNETASAGTTNPGSRLGAATAFDPVRNGTFLSGGSNGVATYETDVWELSATGSWSALPSPHAPPGAFFESSAAWDGSDGYLVDFGSATLSASNGPPTVSGIDPSTWALLTELTAELEGPTTGAPNASLSFDGSGTDGGLPPYAFTWSFGDGHTATGSATVSHAFAAPGNFTVSVSVTDAAGQTAAAYVRVVVSASTAPPGGGLGPAGSTLEYAGIGVAVLVVAAAVVVLLRRRGGRRPPPAAPGVPPD